MKEYNLVWLCLEFYTDHVHVWACSKTATDSEENKLHLKGKVATFSTVLYVEVYNQRLLLSKDLRQHKQITRSRSKTPKTKIPQLKEAILSTSFTKATASSNYWTVLATYLWQFSLHSWTIYFLKIFSSKWLDPQDSITRFSLRTTHIAWKPTSFKWTLASFQNGCDALTNV